MFFPIWMLFLVPVVWLIVLPVNLLIDAVVVWIALSVLRVSEKKKVLKSVIHDVLAFGFGADFIGAICMLGITLMPIHGDWWVKKVVYPINYNPFQSIVGFVVTGLCVGVSGYCIYRFNDRAIAKSTDLSETERKKVCLSLAIATAPYFFYLPADWFI